MDFCIWQVMLEGFGSGRNKRRIILAPDSQQMWLTGAQVFLELRIKRHICAVVLNKVILHLCALRQTDVISI